MTKRCAIVTGGTSGIGLAVAMELATHGYEVGVLGRRQVLTEEPVARLKQAGHHAIPLCADVCDPQQVEQAFQSFVAETGRLDTVVAAAGIFASGTVSTISVEQWNEVINTNLSGMFYTAKFAMPHLVLTKGSFIAIGSTAGICGISDSLAYSASKHGVTGLVRSLALDYGPSGVRVNQICPGIIMTPMAEKGLAGVPQEAILAMQRAIPAGRFGAPEEIAKAALYLSSDDARFVSGATLTVDGATTAGLFRPPP
jgi:meso-butanediol dehydrogenase/(S,S)-butanediol dehydrogenase/diacetyl reductase